jgi:hypothetical protein
MLSHAWIVVPTGASERSALEAAGFRIAPTVNHHDGQGTSSISVEFVNGYLELIYPDPSVPVAPERQAGAEKFRLKSQWRESGYSPIGIVFERTPATPETFPFPTWRIAVDWMEPGTSLEMLTPRETPKALSLSISPHPGTTVERNQALLRDPLERVKFEHRSGMHRLTAMRVVAPSAESLPPAASYLAEHGLMTFEVGDEWLLEVTLDDGAQHIVNDLRPALPMLIRT